MASSPPSQIILVGHCGPDAGYLRYAVQSALPEAAIQMADERQTLDELLASDASTLLLVNRVLDYGFDSAEGIDLIQSVGKTHPMVRCMLISNYPEAQAAAVAAGALPGFGKRDVRKPLAAQRLREAFQS